MASSLYPIVKFSAGEFSPSLDSRIDLENYRDGCRRLRNVIPCKQGGALRRPGAEWIAPGKVASTGAKSISSFRKFQYAPGTAFELEFCDHGIRFYSNGAQVTLNPGTLPNWVMGTSYPAGSFVQLGGFGFYLYAGTNGLGTALIDSSISPGNDPAHWSIQFNGSQVIYEVPSPYSGTNFTAPGYWAADVCQLVILQINDVVYIVHPNYPVWKLTRYTNTNWVMQQVQFLTPAMMDENSTDETLAASGTTGTVTLTAAANQNWAGGAYYVPGNTVLEGGLIYDCLQAHTSGTFTTDLANGLWVLVTNFVAAHVGSYWQLAYNRPTSYIELDAVGTSASYSFSGGTWYNQTTGGGGGPTSLYLIGTWEIQTYGTWQGDATVSVSYDNGASFQVITILSSRGDANYSISGQELDGGIYKFTMANPVAWASTTPPRVVLTADNQFVYGLVLITAVAGPYSATATVITPLYATTATEYWSEGAWSAVRGYPQAITIFQERVWYGYSAAEPQRVWATQTDDIENFALIDQSQATYGLAFDLNAAGRGPIQWLAAQTDLFCGLASAEWIISSGATTTAITASQIQALENTVNGSAPALPALIIGQACFYVQRKGRSFQQMMFSVFTNKYMSQDMQVTSQHLTNAGIVQFDYQQQFQEQSLLWAVCGDGTLISMTYAMDQKVFAWAGHNTGSDAGDVVISAQVIYGAAGQDDEVWLTVLRNPATATGCQIERLYPIDWQTYNVGQPQLNQACYADCATFYVYPANSSINTISGLPLCLIGRTLVASITPAVNTGMWAIRNLPCTAAVFPASGGAVTIPNYVPAAGDVVVVGLPINWEIMPMRLDVDPRAGPTPGLTKSIKRLHLRTLNSIGGQWATTAAPPVLGTLSNVIDIQAYPITQNADQPPPFTANIPQDVELDVGGLFGYMKDPEFAIQGYDPLPFFLLGIAIEVDLGGRT
jgi:hypothetical protein